MTHYFFQPTFAVNIYCILLTELCMHKNFDIFRSFLFNPLLSFTLVRCQNQTMNARWALIKYNLDSLKLLLFFVVYS